MTIKKLTLIAVALSPLLISTANAGQYVGGYYKKNGTYVAPHYRSKSDSRCYNNSSTKGNVNPYNGKRGYKSPYKTYTPYSGYGSRRYGAYDERFRNHGHRGCIYSMRVNHDGVCVARALNMVVCAGDDRNAVHLAVSI